MSELNLTPQDLGRRIWHNRGLWLRILFCWALGSSLPFFDETKDYDVRFRLRGNQDISKQIVIVYLDQEDWSAHHGPSANSNLLRSLKEFAPITDNFFWRARSWEQLLGKILAQNPRRIGVSFFFSDELPRPDSSFKALTDPRVFWAGLLDNEGRLALPLMADSYGYNVALVDLREDEDRILRRVATPLAPLPHMGMKLAEGLTAEPAGFPGETKLINFRGPAKVFPSVSALAVWQDRIPPGFFKDKIVLIGSHSVQSHIYQTPVGRMSRADVLAQVTDNMIGRRWISRMAVWQCSLYLLLILLLTVLTLTQYPQTIAVVFLLWLTLGTAALSFGVFDSLYLWVPALSAVVLMLITYVIFIGYQLAVKENQTWRLEQETALLSELDQLRNNFVSLISHDLKTPIAKIQAICDRLLSAPATPEGVDEVKDGLLSVRKESVELHRYIQSILQLSRLEASQTQVRKEATDINELVEKVVLQLNPLLMDKRQAVDVHLEPMFSLEVDSVMIQEVILNLIENAVKYTPPDGRIEVRTQEVDDRVIFTVKDNGPGIAPEDRAHIFEKFFRGKAQQTATKGTGLGLFLVKYFVELHGGEVFLESDVGKGTRVGFALPLEAGV